MKNLLEKSNWDKYLSQGLQLEKLMSQLYLLSFRHFAANFKKFPQ